MFHVSTKDSQVNSAIYVRLLDSALAIFDHIPIHYVA
jgi:hypothetical protein